MRSVASTSLGSANSPSTVSCFQLGRCERSTKWCEPSPFTYLDTRASGSGSRYVAQASKLQLLSQRLAKNAEVASISGDSAAFDETGCRSSQILIFENWIEQKTNSIIFFLLFIFFFPFFSNSNSKFFSF